MRVQWPLGDAALLVVLGAWLVVSQVAVRALAVRGRAPAEVAV
jgi:hypothetical protein